MTFADQLIKFFDDLAADAECEWAECPPTGVLACGHPAHNASCTNRCECSDEA